MPDNASDALRYPIGLFQAPEIIDGEQIDQWMDTIRIFPQTLKNLVGHLREHQLDTHYRPKGWTVRQTVHYLADSHMNAYMRFKLALTEDNPTIKPYDEAAWAECADYSMPAVTSLIILDGVHTRWSYLLENMSPLEYRRTYFHPEHNKKYTLDVVLGMYEWHSRHHYAHIKNILQEKGWVA